MYDKGSVLRVETVINQPEEFRVRRRVRRDAQRRTGTAVRRDVESAAARKWLIHCHIGHHTTNNNVEMSGGGGLMMLIEASPG
jgi:FtsP/CotA-like multicopper oxidase with cupredoxin domain